MTTITYNNDNFLYGLPLALSDNLHTIKVMIHYKATEDATKSNEPD